MCRLPGFVSFVVLVASAGWGREAPRPNVLVIMADDLGYSDLGCYGGEIETPHLDGLAANGLRFTQFYNTARCWPTRAALLTGYYAQQVRRDALPGVKRGNRPDWARLLPEMLKPAGYRSYHSGKWHVDGMSLASGFDRSYYVNNHGFFRLKFHYLDDKRQPPTPLSPDFYVTDAMADHAAMVYSMDAAIGRVLDQLRAMNAFENTLVLFLSDNGASAEIMVRGDGHDPKAPLGSAFTYLCLGPGWSTACNTPFRKHKTWTHEGGIRTPLVAHWPKGIKARGELRGTVGHVIDVVPTLLELAGARPFERWKGKPVPPAPGKSLVRTFAKDEVVGRDALWWFHDGHRALRLKDWKLVAAKGAPWELFDLAADPAETRNLAAEHPEKVAAMEKRWLALQEEFRLTATGESR